VLLSGILGPAVMSQERRPEHRREEPREHDRQRQHRDERDEEGRNTLGDAAGHNRTLATLVQGRWDLVALIVGFVRATAKSRRAASAAAAAWFFIPTMTPAPCHGFPGCDPSGCEGRAVKDGRVDRYPAHRREVPLRRPINPYASRVVEVTLEQTQVARVVPRYEGGVGER
jgi:hypothetical protein